MRIQELGVICRVVLFVKASGKTEVGKFDMAFFIDENVVRLDVSGNG
jgi:hypothetical protein